ncbi:uncharacterized protein K444DRAFT_80872 [Hyaloscypha bicolor E]|uniref:Uncharacterized protein n=1 Tax=Hyaloscypha bicolor E TaxID=1095630 RepID=A0A2J6SYH2_9HELO|nr:uncharacterized protein K444DRAFT_80872 [Hyaloscypha bicolor E]PMD55816.1 hypothetical protein K444DRAFT_80872 [Hyaloscypha bicolor E]
MILACEAGTGKRAQANAGEARVAIRTTCRRRVAYFFRGSELGGGRGGWVCWLIACLVSAGYEFRKSCVTRFPINRTDSTLLKNHESWKIKVSSSPQ